MFFNISLNFQKNYPCHWQLGKFRVSTDPGWELVQIGTSEILYKGYADSSPLENLFTEIIAQDEPKITGNFCALVLTDGELKIKTDRYRSFPIYIIPGNPVYIDPNHINNLIPTEDILWSNNLVTIHADHTMTGGKFDLVGSADLPTSTVDQIDELLTKKIQSFVSHNKLPLRIFLSGGVDTLLVYSYLRRIGAEHELIWYLHTDLDEFYLANSGDLKNYWAYNQIHHWKEPCVLASGAPGDEFMLRNPVTGNQYLLGHRTSIPEQLIAQPKCLHHAHFTKSFKKFEGQVSATSEELCNITVNDWQHWHLGNTLTWTPLRDLELFKLFLALPYETALGQIMDSAVSRVLIERNVPGLTKVLSSQKNAGNGLQNLRSLLT
jgi:hypothetical protein